MSRASDFIIDNGVLKKYVGPGGDVVIPEGVTKIDFYSFRGCSGVTSIKIPYGVTSIEEWTFKEISSLTNVTIPDSVTTIGTGAFEECIRLKSLTIPESVTNIGSSAFKNCVSLSSLTIKGGAVNIGDKAFRGCSGLSDEAGLVIVGNVLFDYKGSGGNVTIPTGVTVIGESAFSGCKNVTNVTISKSVTRIGGWAFSDCTGLKRITIPDSVTFIGQRAFLHCGCTIKIKNWSVMLADAVKDCKEMRFQTEDPIQAFPANKRPQALLGFAEETEIDLHAAQTKTYFDYAKKNAGKLMESAFQHQELLSFLCDYRLLPSTIIDLYLVKAEEMGDVEKKARLLDYQNDLGAEELAKGKAANERAKDAYMDALLDRVAARDPGCGLEGLTFVIAGSFNRWPTVWSSKQEVREYLKTYGAALGASVTKKTDYLVVADREKNSESCRRAQELGVQILSEETFNEMVGRRFKDAPQISIPAWLKIIPKEAFKSCVSLTSVTIPDGVTSIEEGAFYGCSGLKSITMPTSLTEIGDKAFTGCQSLTGIAIPRGVTQLGEYSFSGCENITSVMLPDSLLKIDYGAFICCRSLANISIPESVTTIGCKAFDRCSALKDVIIPDGVTALVYETFHGCESLSSVRIPASVNEITKDAFANCPKLTIHAPAGSYAEQYAKENNIPFVAE